MSIKRVNEYLSYSLTVCVRKIKIVYFAVTLENFHTKILQFCCRSLQACKELVADNLMTTYLVDLYFILKVHEVSEDFYCSISPRSAVPVCILSHRVRGGCVYKSFQSAFFFIGKTSVST